MQRVNYTVELTAAPYGIVFLSPRDTILSPMLSFTRIFLHCLLVFSAKGRKNPEVATFTCGGYERGSSQLRHLLVSVLEHR